MDGRKHERETDRLLSALVKRNAPAVYERAFGARVTAAASSRRRGRMRVSRLRIAAVAFASVVLAAAAAYGVYVAVDHFRAQPVLILGDGRQPDTTGTASPSTTLVLVSAAEAQAMIATITGASVELTRGARAWTIEPATMRDLLDDPSRGAGAGAGADKPVPAPRISAERLGDYLEEVAGDLEVPAVDASFQTDGTAVWVAAGTAGATIDASETAGNLTVAALKTTGRTAVLALTAVDPELTTAEARAMGITTQLGSYQTQWTGTPVRQHNVKLATEKTSNKLVAPGEEYDFAKVLGPRTKEEGFTIVPGIGAGGLEDVFGGAICQVSTTAFNAALLAGLKITERWNHSLYIDHYPAGRDATITSGAAPKDLRFVNDTPGYIWIWAESDGISTTFVIFGTDDGRKVTLQTSERYGVTAGLDTTTVLDPALPLDSTSVVFGGQDAFKLKVTRNIEWPKGRTTTDTFISEWKAAAKIVAVPTSTTTATTVP
jgi:vancomycin resistance protein YoaR